MATIYARLKAAVNEDLEALAQFISKHNALYMIAKNTGICGFYGTITNLKGEKVSGNGVYEPDTTKYIIETLKPNDTFIDCGANVGYFSCLASGLAKHGKIFAFEPVKSTFKILQDNTKHMTNVQLINKAVGNSNGKAYINISRDESGRNSLINVANIGKEEILLTTLDSQFPEGLPNLKIIKLDVEGYEKEAIEGGQRLLKAQMPDIIFEFNHGLLYLKNRKYNEVFDLLKKIGYSKFIELSTGKEVESYIDLSNNSENILALGRPGGKPS